MIRALGVGQRLATSILRKILNNFSKEQKRPITMLERTKIHSTLLDNPASLTQYLTDEKLMELVDSHHFLADIVELATFITKQHFQNNKLLSDSKAAFLVFTYNLYHDRIEPQILLFLIISQLNQKISSNAFEFKSELIERLYLQQLHCLTYRTLPSFEQQKEFTLLYFRFIQKKFKIDGMSNTEIDDEAIQKLWSVLPYLPEQSKNRIIFLDQLERTVLRVLSYQFQRLSENQSQIQETKSDKLDRLCKMRQICIRLSNYRQRMLGIFAYIPYTFSKEQRFIRFMFALKEFMTSQLSAIATKREMNTFHRNLSQQNKHYQSKQSYRSVQSYCESLIFLNVYRPSDFVNYFDPQGVTYITLDKKYWNTKRWDHDKKD